jgi:hypothetical protein
MSRAWSSGRGRAAVGDSAEALSRRKIFKRAVGVAAVGAAGGSVLGIASPASAAEQSTTVEPGAVAPAVVSLTDAPSITVDASLGNDFRVTIAGDRTMVNPSNPTNGQQIVFQITQGAGGSYTITWGSGYAFSAGLPQPTLSTQQGKTDLLFFVYNATAGNWLLTAFVNGFAAGGGGGGGGGSGPYRLFPSSHPSTLASYGGSICVGVAFEVTSGGTWLEGYWWWVFPSGQSTSAQKFALWSAFASGGPNTPIYALVPGSVVTSGTLTPGQWNFVSLPTPIALSPNVPYVAQTGFTGGFPDDVNQFGSGDPYSAGITSGPLFAYSDASGSAPAPSGIPQGNFTASGSDPTTNSPGGGYESSNFGMDVQVTTTVPTGGTFRLWPSYPEVTHLSTDTGINTNGTEFSLSQPCNLVNIWHYSGSGATVLPSKCGIWSVASQTVVSGTENDSPSWSGAAGSGWVSCSYSGVTLPAGEYKVTVYSNADALWYYEQADYWSSGPGANGITAGPLSAPNTTNATSPGQSSYHTGSWAFPDTFDTGDDGETRWVDVEVTPA